MSKKLIFKYFLILSFLSDIDGGGPGGGVGPPNYWAPLDNG